MLPRVLILHSQFSSLCFHGAAVNPAQRKHRQGFSILLLSCWNNHAALSGIQYTCKVHCLGASYKDVQTTEFWTQQNASWRTGGPGRFSSPGPLAGPFVPTKQQRRACWLLICISRWTWWSWAAFQLLPCQSSGFHLFLYLPALTTAVPLDVVE